jgi:hypothetical protein
MTSFRERFWSRVCRFRAQLYLLFVLDIVLLVAAAVAVPFVTPGSGAAVILTVDLALFLTVGAGLGFLLYRCRRRESERRR